MAILFERDYNIRLMDLPTGVKGLVKEKGDYYTIVLNSRLTWEQNRKTFRHDYDHLEDNDYEKSDVDAIESISHKKGGLT